MTKPRTNKRPKEQYIITQELLQNRFAEYNKLYFHGKLEMPTFRIQRRTYGGIFGAFRHNEDGTPRITINDAKKIGWDDEMLKSVLIHEMLHYYMDRFWILKIDNGLHLFFWQALRIYKNLKYGLNVKTNDPRG